MKKTARQDQSVPPSATKAAEQQSMGQRISEQIAIDRRLNAVILSGCTAQVAALRALSRRIDIPLPSVLLETQVVELTDTARSRSASTLAAGGRWRQCRRRSTRSTSRTGRSTYRRRSSILSRAAGKAHRAAEVVAQHGIAASISPAKRSR